MREIMIGDVAATSIIERDGLWRRPEALFPRCDLATARHHLSEMEDFLFDPSSGMLVITYQTFVLRTPHHTILIDTCTGEDKGYLPPLDFSKAPQVGRAPRARAPV